MQDFYHQWYHRFTSTSTIYSTRVPTCLSPVDQINTCILVTRSNIAGFQTSLFVAPSCANKLALQNIKTHPAEKGTLLHLLAVMIAGTTKQRALALRSPCQMAQFVRGMKLCILVVEVPAVRLAEHPERHGQSSLRNAD